MKRAVALAEKTVVLGVSGSIAAYKAAQIASGLTQAGVRVPVIMTAAAQEFVQPLTFESLTHEAVHCRLFGAHVVQPGHISLAERADLLVVAPATAQTLARLALGLADDLLSCVALATTAPVLVAPAMNDNMYAHPATQANLQTLRNRGAHIVEPETGRLASGKSGKGRMAGPDAVVAAALRLLEGGAPCP